MMESNDVKWSGFPLSFVCHGERDVDEATQQINTIADALAKTNKVYWRRPIEVFKDSSFETGQTWVYVTARLAYAAVEPYGLYALPRVYDNNNVVTSFGLSIDNNRR